MDSCTLSAVSGNSLLILNGLEGTWLALRKLIIVLIQKGDLSMNKQMKLLVAAAIASTLTGFAFATPQKKVIAPVLGIGTNANDIEVHGAAQTSDGRSFRVSLETEGPTSITTNLGAYAAGGQNGWHSHPGMVIVTLTKGSIQWYDANCKLTVYEAGDSWMEGSQVHYLRVVGPSAVQFVTTFIVAQGQANRIDQAAPACAAALGLNE